MNDTGERMIGIISNCLSAVTQRRFYETERGFQGEFLANLRTALPGAGLPGEAIVEQEYQKRFHEHGIVLRPDIIVHVPALIGADRRHCNFVVFELKLAAQPQDAAQAFESLDAVMGALDYPLGIFVNIASEDSHAGLYRGRFPDRIHCFAVQHVNERGQVKHASFNGVHFVEGA